MAVFSIGDMTEKSELAKSGQRWFVDNSHVGFGKKFHGEKGNVQWCVIMMDQRVLSSLKFGEKFSHILMQSQ
jgi:hypothetical protein